MKLAAMALVSACAAPLESQAADVFASEVGCPSVSVRARLVQREHHYDTVEVRGCGYRQTYVCNIDIGCARGKPSDDLATFPPMLVDQVAAQATSERDNANANLQRQPFIVQAPLR